MIKWLLALVGVLFLLVVILIFLVVAYGGSEERDRERAQKRAAFLQNQEVSGSNPNSKK